MIAVRISRRTMGSTQARVERELLAQLLGATLVPRRVKRLHVPQQLPHAHPAGQIGLFRQVPNLPEYLHGFLCRVEAEHAHPPALGAEQSEHMFDEGRLARAVLADEAEDAAGGDGEADVVECELGAEPPRDVGNLHDGLQVRLREPLIADGDHVAPPS
jgi:hypothetical protein